MKARFRVGQEVEVIEGIVNTKYGDAFIRAVFLTGGGKLRYVVERDVLFHDTKFIHRVYSAKQLMKGVKGIDDSK